MNEAVKKNLMFVSSDDFYLLIYSIIIILDCLGCAKGKVFKDYRKLPFIIELIINNRNILILEASETLHKSDKDFLFHSYTNGLAKRSETLKILFTLEKKGYVTLLQGDIEKLINITLNKENLPQGFLSKEVFKNEYMNCEKFKKTIQRSTAITLDTFLSKVYRDRGIKIWEV
ncbi:hypothetical protein P3W55_25700 [Pseudomonas citronellolis]|uniref:Uncharacterized protein n=1 Tax=Pseudomonas citronellolis TaxID=53408 RepID=A0AAW6PFP6_9PSED|nr:hypothetical protein [Pseudomonas citronellolis]MDF3845118.1 hypothetical protein [Pseudomonas citronellolis]